MRKPKKFVKRHFLNKPGYNSLAAIYAKIDSGGSSTHAWVTAEVDLSDCNRQITLDFDTYLNDDGSGGENAVFKLDELISTLQAFREAYADHLDYAQTLLLGESS